MSVVLLVEDETLIRMTAVDSVERAGHVAVEASNADEATRILETRTDIQVVFSDVNMPGPMDGLGSYRFTFATGRGEMSGHVTAGIEGPPDKRSRADREQAAKNQILALSRESEEACEE